MNGLQLLTILPGCIGAFCHQQEDKTPVKQKLRMPNICAAPSERPCFCHHRRHAKMHKMSHACSYLAGRTYLSHAKSDQCAHPSNMPNSKSVQHSGLAAESARVVWRLGLNTCPPELCMDNSADSNCQFGPGSKCGQMRRKPAQPILSTAPAIAQQKLT